LSTPSAVLFFLAAFFICQVGFCDQTEILGLRLGSSLSAVRDSFQRNGIAVSEPVPGVITASRTPAALDGVREVRCVFGKDELYKIVLDFEIPPREPSAANLLAVYDKEKLRLKTLYGEPAQDLAEMRAPTTSERHEWLKRGRAYYRTQWTIPDKTKATLWLYGEDADIVLVEVYEKTDK